jgi:hypothetical protein
MLSSMNAIHVEHKRGLAGSVRAKQRYSFATSDIEIHSEQRLVAIGVGEGKVFDCEATGHESLP